MSLVELIKSPKLRYIIITFFVSAIGFLKSFVLLKIFDSESLGIVALAQTIISTMSLLQFGVITGGYRLFSYKKEPILKKINSAVLMFFSYLTIISCGVGAMLNQFVSLNITTSMLVYLIIIGVVSLYSSWVVCKLLGSKNIKTLNNAQVISAIISFLIVVSAKWFGIQLVLFGLFMQPVIVIIMAYLQVPKLIPSFNHLNFKKYIVKIVMLGFIPYLTSALTLLNSQLGRWIITISLGTAILGKTYLVTLFITLVSVFPGAISNMFFPTIIEKYEMNMHEDLKSSLKRQFIILGGYYIIIMVGTIFLAKVLVDLFLPKHVESVNLIYAIAPSLLFLHMSVPIITLFNAAKKFKQILFGSLVSVFTYIMMLSTYAFFFTPNLFNFYIIESISALFFFLYNLFYFIKITKSKYDESIA